MDFGAARDGVPDCQRDRRVVVDSDGNEINEERAMDLDGIDES